MTDTADILVESITELTVEDNSDAEVAIRFDDVIDIATKFIAKHQLPPQIMQYIVLRIYGTGGGDLITEVFKPRNIMGFPTNFPAEQILYNEKDIHALFEEGEEMMAQLKQGKIPSGMNKSQPPNGQAPSPPESKQEQKSEPKQEQKPHKRPHSKKHKR